MTGARDKGKPHAVPVNEGRLSQLCSTRVVSVGRAVSHSCVAWRGHGVTCGKHSSVAGNTYLVSRAGRLPRTVRVVSKQEVTNRR